MLNKIVQQSPYSYIYHFLPITLSFYPHPQTINQPVLHYRIWSQPYVVDLANSKEHFESDSPECLSRGSLKKTTTSTLLSARPAQRFVHLRPMVQTTIFQLVDVLFPYTILLCQLLAVSCASLSTSCSPIEIGSSRPICRRVLL